MTDTPNSFIQYRVYLEFIAGDLNFKMSLTGPFIWNKDVK